MKSFLVQELLWIISVFLGNFQSGLLILPADEWFEFCSQCLLQMVDCEPCTAFLWTLLLTAFSLFFLSVVSFFFGTFQNVVLARPSGYAMALSFKMVYVSTVEG